MKFIFLIILLFLSTDLMSKEIILVCQIKEELENNISASKKMYNSSNIKIYFDHQNKWIGDISYKNWFKEDYKDLVKKELIEKNKLFFFNYKKFFTDKKNKVESEYLITIEKINGFMQFLKSYYNENNEVFFSSEIRGYCNKI